MQYNISILYTVYILLYLLQHLTITDSDLANSYNNSEKELVTVVSVFNINNNNKNMLTMIYYYVNKNKASSLFLLSKTVFEHLFSSDQTITHQSRCMYFHKF